MKKLFLFYIAFIFAAFVGIGANEIERKLNLVLEEYKGTIYRGMLTNSDGTPFVYSGETDSKKGLNAAKSLGVRPDETNMSTGIDPYELPSHRKPTEFGGTFKNGVMFSIDTNFLDQYGLIAIKDGDNHVGIFVKEEIDPDELGERLAKTKNHWKRVNP